MLKPNFDQAEFLKDYWQQKPILIKNFFSNFEDYTNPEELLEIACINAVDSRIVTTRPEYCVAERYSLTQGPFDADSPACPNGKELEFARSVSRTVDSRSAGDDPSLWLSAPLAYRRHHGVVSHSGWRCRPHFDQYDVFLVQGLGQRTWCIGERIDLTAPHTSLADTASGLNLIDEFEVNQQFTVKAGCSLYSSGLHPLGNFPNSSLCYSVGFRAPSNAEMIESFSNRVMELLTESQRLTDHTTPAMRDSAEITAKDWQHAWEVVAGHLANKGAFLRAFGSLVTEANRPSLSNRSTMRFILRNCSPSGDQQ